MEATSPHDDVVRASFAQQVPLFTGPASPFAGRSSGLGPWGSVQPDWIVLDVACGAGHVAEQLAPHVRQVVGIDLTPALLDVGARRLGDAGVANVLLQEGDAAALPFVDGSFDLVVCRSSLHHFADPPASVREMARVCRSGGRVAINELVQPPGADAATAERYDRLHRLLDPSHLHAMTVEELVDLVGGVLGSVDHQALGEPAMLPLDVIFTAVSDRPAALAMVKAELAGGEPTGFEPVEVDGVLQVTFRSLTIQAAKGGLGR